ncbi:monocarboxylate transporter 3-like isoform X1 [Pararge aegeria]|uniref:monocarboxylate transporter 3-like isoform X1 n=1 Tax=Pararge aegeria TaxID=116150 RepID=UPI0019D03754|nr:monocarboxylate transporter 3-like isoform X1 [Pararge aegeria]
MDVKKTKNKKYELVAPDGGWGYMICLGVILNMISITSFVHCFGIIYKELFIELKMDCTSITFFNGLTCFGIAVSGFFTSPLLKYMSFRKLGFLAALIFNIGLFGTVFTNSQLHFFIFQGLLQSIGHGIVINLSFTILNNYFVKRRLLAVSFTQTVAAAFGFLTPQMVKWAIERYGFRGCVMLITGISMHNLFAIILMQPVSWHMKKVEVFEDIENETYSLLVKNKKYATKKEDLTASNYSYNKSESATVEDNLKIVEETANANSSRLKKFVNHIIDVSLFRTFFLSNACIGAALALFTEMTFTLMVPQALYFSGWSENEVAWAVSLNAFGDLVARTLLIFMSSLLVKVGSHQIYIVGLVIAFGSRLGMLWSDNRRVITTFMTIMGISRCSIMVLTPVVVADSVEQKLFSSAMGLLFLIFGFFNLIVGPVIGAVRDLTDSYATAFYILTSFYAIVIMFWTIELFYKKSKHKRQSRADITSSKS